MTKQDQTRISLEEAAQAIDTVCRQLAAEDGTNDAMDGIPSREEDYQVPMEREAYATAYTATREAIRVERANTRPLHFR